MKPYYFRMQNEKLKHLSCLPEAPYYAVIFTSQRTEPGPSSEGSDYALTAQRMLVLAAQQPGYLGVDSVRENHTGITVSYWKDEDSIEQWRQQVEHLQAQKLGKTRWYDEYSVRIAKVERSYSFTRESRTEESRAEENKT